MVQYLSENGPEVISDSRKLKFSWRSMQPPHTHLVGHFTHKLGLWPPLAHLFCSTLANVLNVALKIFEILGIHSKQHQRFPWKCITNYFFPFSWNIYFSTTIIFFNMCKISIIRQVCMSSDLISETNCFVLTKAIVSLFVSGGSRLK